MIVLSLYDRHDCVLGQICNDDINQLMYYEVTCLLDWELAYLHFTPATTSTTYAELQTYQLAKLKRDCRRGHEFSHDWDVILTDHVTPAKHKLPKYASDHQ